MRVAICLYGHLRTYSVTCKSLIKHIVKANPNVDFDIFVSCWMENDYTRPDNIVSKTSVVSAYQTKYIQLHDKNSINYESYIARMGEYFSLPVINTFFHIDVLEGMVCEVEQEKGVFDIVVLSRPDIDFLSELPLDDFVNKVARGGLETSLDKTIFIPYILSDYRGQIFDDSKYACGIDLLSISDRRVLKYFSLLDPSSICLGNREHLGIEFVISKLLSDKEVAVRYFGYEKDRAFRIRRVPSSIERLVFSFPMQTLLNTILFIVFPLFFFSVRFRRYFLFNQHLLAPKKVKRLWWFMK